MERLSANQLQQHLAARRTGVLLNDDPNGGGPLVAELDSAVSNGTLTFASDGGFVYTPTTDFVGSDSFTYHARNAGGVSNRATVRISVARSVIPFPPSDLFVSEVRGRRVTLRWTPPPAVSAIPAFYTIEGGTQPGSTEAMLNTGMVPVFTFDAPSGAFFVRVRAISLLILRGPTTLPVILRTRSVSTSRSQSRRRRQSNYLRQSMAMRSRLRGATRTVPASPHRCCSCQRHCEFNTAVGIERDGRVYGSARRHIHAVAARTKRLRDQRPVEYAHRECTDGVFRCAEPPSRFLAYRQQALVTTLWEPPLYGPAPTDYIITVTGSSPAAFRRQHGR